MRKVFSDFAAPLGKDKHILLHCMGHKRTNAWMDESCRDHNQANRVWIFSLWSYTSNKQLLISRSCQHHQNHTCITVSVAYVWLAGLNEWKNWCNTRQALVIILLRIVWVEINWALSLLIGATWQPPLGSCSGWQTGAWLLGLLKPVGLWHSYWLDLSRIRGWTESGTCLVCFYYELFPSTLCCMLGCTSSVRFRGLFKRPFSIGRYCFSTK